MTNLGISEADLSAFTINWADFLPGEIASSKNFTQAVISTINRRDELAKPEACQRRIDGLGLKINFQNIAERKILTEKGPVIAGVRYKGLDIRFPFIDFLCSFRVQSDRDIKILSRIASEFPEIDPKGFTFHEAPDLQFVAQKWKCYLWGKTDTGLNLSLPSHLNLIAQTDADFYETYHDEYLNWMRSHPDLKGYVRIEKKEDLVAAARSGLLFSLSDQHGWAGLIAGTMTDFMGTPAVYIFELFLSERMRGRHVAAHMQFRFLEAVKGRIPWVWGHIHSENLPSLKTAQSLGRKVIQTEYFVPMK